MSDLRHELTPDGESTAFWAWRRPGFIGSVQQLTTCARCGGALPPKRYDEPRRYRFSPVLHVLCDGCFDALPD